MANSADFSTSSVSEHELQKHTDGKAIFQDYLVVVSSVIITQLCNIKCIFQIFNYVVMFNVEIGTWDDIFRFEDDFPDLSTFDSSEW